jgi:hypothetical protein
VLEELVNFERKFYFWLASIRGSTCKFGPLFDEIRAVSKRAQIMIVEYIREFCCSFASLGYMRRYRAEADLLQVNDASAGRSQSRTIP